MLVYSKSLYKMHKKERKRCLYSESWVSTWPGIESITSNGYFSSLWWQLRVISWPCRLVVPSTAGRTWVCQPEHLQPAVTAGRGKLEAIAYLTQITRSSHDHQGSFWWTSMRPQAWRDWRVVMFIQRRSTDPTLKAYLNQYGYLLAEMERRGLVTLTWPGRHFPRRGLNQNLPAKPSLQQAAYIMWRNYRANNRLIKHIKITQIKTSLTLHLHAKNLR
jgi:hypothetical protein